MKKFNFLRLLSLVLTAIMCLSMVACGNGGNGESADNNGGGSEEDAEKLFAEIKEAVEASFAYNGAITATLTQNQTAQRPDYNGAQTWEASSIISVDKANNRSFLKNTQKYSGRESESRNKIFTVDGEVYFYASYMDEEGTYVKYGDDIEGAYARADVDDDINDLMDAMVGGTFIADSYAELKNAHDTVFPKLLANELAYMESEGELIEGAELTLTPELSIARKDGAVVLTVVTRFTASEMADGDGTLKNVSATMTRTYVAKDGKVSDISVRVESKCDVEDEEGKSGSELIDTLIAYNMVYSFDEEGYNGIEVSLPEDPSLIELPSEDNLVISVGGVTNGHGSSASDTASVLSGFATHIEGQYGNIIDDMTGESIPNVSVKGFYTDAEFTQKVDESISLDELYALDVVYADIEIIDGYSMINFDFEDEDATSRDYQIVFSGLFYGSDIGADSNRLYRAGEEFVFEYRTSRDRDYKVLVNGIETEAASFVPENGKAYVVTYVEITQDKDLGISHVINFGF